MKVFLLAGAALTLVACVTTPVQQSTSPPAWVDVTWMSVTNMYYEIGSIGVVTDGYISRVPRDMFFGGASGIARTRASFASDSVTVREVLTAIGGPSRVQILLSAHSHFDHSFDIPTWSKLALAKIVGPRTTCLQAEALDVPATRCTAVFGGERINVADGVTVRVVRWNHSGDPAVNPEQHNPVELATAPMRDPVTGGLRAGVTEDYPNGGGSRAFLFTVKAAAGRYSWFFHNTASAVNLDKPIVVDGVNYRAPLDNLKLAMNDAGLTSVDLWIGSANQSVVPLLLPVLRPKAFLPVHWDDFYSPFKAGVSEPYSNAPVEVMLRNAGVQLLRPAQYMDKWRLDRSGIRAVPNDDVKRALGFMR